MTLYFAIYRYEMEISVKKPSHNLAVMVKAAELRHIYMEMQKELEFMWKRMILYTNKKRLKGSIFKKGNKIYLLWYNIHTKQSNDKFDFKKIGLFLIKEKINDLVYELILSEEMRIHPRFYMSFLESMLAIAKYKVETILDYRGNIGKEEYLVKWKGYNITENI